MAIRKSVEEINEKIRRGEAVVVTAEEVAEMAKDLSPKEIAERVDVVIRRRSFLRRSTCDRSFHQRRRYPSCGQW